MLTFVLTHDSTEGGFGENFLRHLKPSDGKLSFAPTNASDPAATVDELATLLTAGRMSDSHRSTIAEAYSNLLYNKQRMPEGIACDWIKNELHSCAYCSRWYDGRSAYEETEDDGACVYAKLATHKTAKCFPARWVKQQVKLNKMTLMCDSDPEEAKRDSMLMAQQMALQKALKLFFVSSSFHSTNRDQSTGLTRRQPTPQVSRGRPFKALVVLFLHGGADSFNLLVGHLHSLCSQFVYIAVHHVMLLCARVRCCRKK